MEMMSLLMGYAVAIAIVSFASRQFQSITMFGMAAGENEGCSYGCRQNASVESVLAVGRTIGGYEAMVGGIEFRPICSILC